MVITWKEFLRCLCSTRTLDEHTRGVFEAEQYWVSIFSFSDQGVRYVDPSERQAMLLEMTQVNRVMKRQLQEVNRES